MTLQRIALLTSVAGLLFGSLVLSPKVLAQECVTQYGGTVVCPPKDLTINKQVAKPFGQTKGGTVSVEFVENLGTDTDQTFAPGTDVLFRLIVKNSSNQDFTNVTVKDVFPNFVTYTGGPGTYDRPGKPGGVLTFTLKDIGIEVLKAGVQTEPIQILGRVVDFNALTNTPKVFCVVNTGQVFGPDNRFDQNTAQLCIEKEKLGVTTLPVAGVEELFILLPFIGVGLGGLALIRKNR